MSVPQKKKRGLCGTALQSLQLQIQYHIAATLAKVFEAPFWFFEQLRTQLLGRIESERSSR